MARPRLPDLDACSVGGGPEHPRPSVPTVYEIRLRGHLGENMRSAFPGLVAETQGHDTVLRGPLTDQSALYGVLGQVEGLGLELLELRRLP